MLELLIESSSSGEHYAVTFTREGTNLPSSCTCPAGQKGIHCKHRLSLLAGDLPALSVKCRPTSAPSSPPCFGSDVERVLEQLRVAEAGVTAAQAEVKRVKSLDRVMHS